MSTLDTLQKILDEALQLGPRARSLTRSDRLLGSIPEFDSMAVAAIVTMIEDRFGIVLNDDELSAEVFETLGSLVDFVNGKLAH
jgi:acyl carrier protein